MKVFSRLNWQDVLDELHGTGRVNGLPHWMDKNMRVAFLDLDHTLLAADSNQLWMTHLQCEGLISAHHLSVHDQFMRDYACGALNFAALQEFRMGLEDALDPAALLSVRAGFERESLLPAIAPQAHRLMEALAHRQLFSVVVSATRSPLVVPVVQALGIGHAITSCFGQDKVLHVQAWLKERGSSLSDLQESWFFSDSHNDLPLLEAVMHPVVVDPDVLLKEVAIARNWPVITLRAEFSQVNFFPI